MLKFNIAPIQTAQKEKLKQELIHKINSKTKPLGSLGKLEDIALQIGLAQNTLSPVLCSPTMIVFAGDHGAAREGISAFPQEVTFQMVMNFLHGGAAINVFCRQNNIKLSVVDAGVNFDFPSHPDLINAKIRKSTNSYIADMAMTKEECLLAIEKGASIVHEIHQKTKCNIIGFGEMGIGNTSSASLIFSSLIDIPLADCVGAGTGHNSDGIKKKLALLSKALAHHRKNSDHKTKNDPLEILSTFGGFEIAMMCGAMLKAAELGMIVLVDGFICTSAYLCGEALNRNIKDYCIFTHSSDEQAHKKILETIQVTPVLDLKMRLGEGTGAAVSYPIICSAVNFLNEMASFESASVSERSNS